MCVDVSVFKLDKLAVGIVGRLFRHYCQASAHSLDDAGQVVDIVRKVAAFNGQYFGFCGFGCCGGLFCRQSSSLSELCNSSAGVVVYVPSVIVVVLCLVVHCLIFLIVWVNDMNIFDWEGFLIGRGGGLPPLV